MRLTADIIDRMKPDDRKALGLHSGQDKQDARDRRTEKQLQSDCENYLRLREIPYLHLSPRAREKKGWPDLVWPDPNYSGQFCAVELKTLTGQVSQEQQELMERLKFCGARVGVIRSLKDFIGFVNNQKG